MKSRGKPKGTTRIGTFGVSAPSGSPNHGRTRFLRTLPHAGDRCKCARCDAARRENASARRAWSWDDEYPPRFYRGRGPAEPRAHRKKPQSPTARRADRKRSRLFGGDLF